MGPGTVHAFPFGNAGANGAPPAHRWNVNANDGNDTQEFIEWLEKIGLSRATELLATAFAVEADNAPDDEVEREWLHIGAHFESLADRIAAVGTSSSGRKNGESQ
jgi:hypothetical protein